MRVGTVAAMAATMVFSLGVPAFATTGQDGPTVPKLGDPVSSPVPEVQIVSVYLTSGTYTLRLNETPSGACYTTAINWNAAGPKPTSGATGASLEEKLEACVAGGGIVVTGVDVKVERMQSTQPASHYVYKVTFVNPDGPLTEMEPFPAGVAVEVDTYQDGVDPATWQAPSGTGGRLSANLNSASMNSVELTGAIPVGTPPSGSIQVRLDTGAWRTVAYGSWTGSTFATAPTNWTDPLDASAGNAVSINTTVSTTQPPHGGFSSLTDYCLQCHSVHDGNEFALLRDDSVTDTCNTCHALFGTAATGPFDSNFATGENTRAMGSAAARSAYDLGDGSLIGGGDIVRGHQIGGIGGGAGGDYTLTDGARTLYGFESARRNGETELQGADGFTAAEVSGATQDGLYCGSCHTPHGDLGQVVNKWVMTDTVRVGTANLTAGDADIVVAFDGGGNYPAGFGSAQRKAAVWFDVNADGIPGAGDFWSLIANQFRNQVNSGVTTTASSAGYVNQWASCAWNPSAGASQNLCVGTLPTGLADYTDVPMYLGNEGISTGISSGRADYDGETTRTTETGWRNCTTAQSAVVEGPDYCTPVSTTEPGWATTTDAEGQSVYLYAYKMLSSGPNHQMAAPNVKGYATSSAETNAWCGTCHETRFDDGSGLHPTHSAGGGCTACHGNPADGSSFDYPHTSTVSRLLKALPDGLCLTCHSQLP